MQKIRNILLYITLVTLLAGSMVTGEIAPDGVAPGGDITAAVDAKVGINSGSLPYPSGGTFYYNFTGNHAFDFILIGNATSGRMDMEISASDGTLLANATSGDDRIYPVRIMDLAINGEITIKLTYVEGGAYELEIVPPGVESFIDHITYDHAKKAVCGINKGRIPTYGGWNALFNFSIDETWDYEFRLNGEPGTDFSVVVSGENVGGLFTITNSQLHSSYPEIVYIDNSTNTYSGNTVIVVQSDASGPVGNFTLEIICKQPALSSMGHFSLNGNITQYSQFEWEIMASDPSQPQALVDALGFVDETGKSVGTRVHITVLKDLSGLKLDGTSNLDDYFEFKVNGVRKTLGNDPKDLLFYFLYPTTFTYDNGTVINDIFSYMINHNTTEFFAYEKREDVQWLMWNSMYPYFNTETFKSHAENQTRMFIYIARDTPSSSEIAGMMKSISITDPDNYPGPNHAFMIHALWGQYGDQQANMTMGRYGTNIEAGTSAKWKNERKQPSPLGLAFEEGSVVEMIILKNLSGFNFENGNLHEFVELRINGVVAGFDQLPEPMVFEMFIFPNLGPDGQNNFEYAIQNPGKVFPDGFNIGIDGDRVMVDGKEIHDDNSEMEFHAMFNLYTGVMIKFDVVARDPTGRVINDLRFHLEDTDIFEYYPDEHDGPRLGGYPSFDAGDYTTWKVATVNLPPLSLDGVTLTEGMEISVNVIQNLGTFDWETSNPDDYFEFKFDGEVTPFEAFPEPLEPIMLVFPILSEDGNLFEMAVSDSAIFGDNVDVSIDGDQTQITVNEQEDNGDTVMFRIDFDTDSGVMINFHMEVKDATGADIGLLAIDLVDTNMFAAGENNSTETGDPDNGAPPLEIPLSPVPALLALVAIPILRRRK